MNLPDLEAAFVDYVRERWYRNLDCYVVVTGREGFGKSTIGCTLGLAVDPDLSPQDVIFTQSDFSRVYDPEAEQRVYVLDEAGRILFNRQWNKRENKDLIQEIMENRQNRNLFILNLPQFKTLDKYTREGRIDLWVTVRDHNDAFLRQLSYDPWAEEAYYPVVVDQFGWHKLEDRYPEWAAEYYARKKQRHVESHAKRVEDTEKKRELEELREKALAKRYERRLKKMMDK